MDSSDSISENTQGFQGIQQRYGDTSLSRSRGGGFKLPYAVLEIRNSNSTIKKTLTAGNGFQHVSIGFTEQGAILSGTQSGNITAYNLKGMPTDEFIGHTGTVLDLAVKGDRLISGSSDQTIKIWSLSNVDKNKDSITFVGPKWFHKSWKDSVKKKYSDLNLNRNSDIKELHRRLTRDGDDDADLLVVPPKIYPLATLFVGSDNEWVLWTKEGFFNASPNGAKYIGYHINQGPEKEARYVSVDKLYNTFYRPDLVEKSLKGVDISSYAANINIDEILTGGFAPTVELTTKGGVYKERDLVLKAKICDQGGGIGKITLFLNGMAVSVAEGSRGMKLVNTRKENKKAECFNSENLISLIPGLNQISMVAFNKDGTIESERPLIEISHKAKTAGKPNLHIMVVGVDKYRDGDLRLQYSKNDATAILKSFQTVGKQLFNNIKTYSLFDDEVRQAKVSKLFEQVGQSAQPEDVFIFYLAGHGVTSRTDGNYYFLPVNFRFTSETAVMEQGLSNDFLQKNLAKVKAQKSLVLLDTCNSGSFTNIRTRGVEEKTAVSRLVRATGRATLMASSKTQVALEGYNDHGVFTWVMLQALEGKGFAGDNQITVNELADYVENELPELTYQKYGYEQVPQKNLQGQNFPLGIR